VKCRPLALAACAGVLALPFAWGLVWAADVKITTDATGGTQWSDNYFLSPHPSGWTLNAFASGGIDVLAQLPTWRFTGSADFNYRRFFGPGASQFSQSDALDYGATLGLEHLGKLPKDREYLSVSTREQNAALAELEQTGLPTTQGNVITTSVIAGLDRQLTALDVLQLSAGATRTTFTGVGTPSTYLRAGSTWNHQLSATTTAFVSSQASWIAYDNLSDDRVLLLQNVGGLETQLGPRLTLRGQFGAVTARAFGDGIGVPGDPVIIGPDGNIIIGTGNQFTTGSGWGTGLIGEGLLRYRLKTGEIAVYGGESISPDVVGTLTDRRWVGSSFRYDVNRHETLSFALDYSQTSARVSDADLFTARASYSRQLARDWRMALTYVFQQRWVRSNDLTGIPGLNTSARSNSILLSLTTNTVVMP
jgi:hypothetical protein